jgi:peptidoglycan/xylan/chitin deacetylase (PgdA/CDA1 family)
MDNLCGARDMTDRSQDPPGTLTILFLALMAAVFLLPACTMLTPKPMLYESENYVVYKAVKKETAGSLAARFLGDEKKAWVVEDANGMARFGRGQIVIIPLVDETRGGLKADGIQTVPILCYHRLTDKCDSSMCLSPRVFDQQMKHLKNNGYRTISLEQLQCFLEFKCSIPEKSVVITLDDGYRSAYEVAYPILKKYGFTATFFIYTDFVGASRNAITWSQLREMKADGFEIGSHTLSHADLTQQREGEAFRVYQDRIEKEIGDSKRIIDKKLTQDTMTFAFPFGRYNATVLRICRQMGYNTGVSVKRGSNPFFADPLALKRNQIMRTDMKYFVSRLKTFHSMSLR